MFEYLNSQSDSVLKEIAKGTDKAANTANFILSQRKIMQDMSAYLLNKGV